MDNLIQVFMHITNYMLWWLKSSSIGKGLDFVSLKSKVVAKCGDPKVLTYAMKSYVWAKDINIRDCALKGLELFGCTKQKLDRPPGAR